MGRSGVAKQRVWWLPEAMCAGRGFRPKPNAAGETDAESDQRILALAAWQQPQQPERTAAGTEGAKQAAQHALMAADAWVLVADSAVQLELLRFDRSGGSFTTAMRLVHHTSPALSLHHLLLLPPVGQPRTELHAAASPMLPELAGPDPGRRHSQVQDAGAACSLAFSGDTQGSLAVWQLSSYAQLQGGAQKLPPAVQPLLALPGWHQSGINAIHACACDTGAPAALPSRHRHGYLLERLLRRRRCRRARGWWPYLWACAFVHAWRCAGAKEAACMLAVHPMRAT